MRKLIALLICMATGYSAAAQTTLQFQRPAVAAEKNVEELIVPLVVTVKNTGPINEQVSIALSSGDATHISFQALTKSVTSKEMESDVTFYAIFPKDYKVTVTTVFTVQVSSNHSAGYQTATINVKPSLHLTYTLDDYFEDPELKLKSVIKVESVNNVLSVTGYHQSNSELVVRRNILLQQGQAYTVINNHFSFYRPDLSLLTVPFKIRPKQGDLKSVAQSGLTNIGLNVDFFGRKWDRYFADASKSAHKLAIGAWLAPSVEELDETTTTSTSLTGGKKSKQMFLSTGLTLSYAYNAVSFVVVPLGFDLPTSELGREWIYKRRYWWGFGIAIEPKALLSILNK